MSKQKRPSGKVALKRLQDGNARFVADRPSSERRDAETRATLLDGQEPFAVVLSCADSRVVPELIFDVGLGEIFVVRVAGNIPNTCTIASIEYAVEHLAVNLVVVLGHERCGAVNAALAGGDHGSNLNSLVAHLVPAVVKARGKTDEAKLNSAIKWNAKHTASQLRARSSILARKSLEITPAYYSLASGKTQFL